MFNVLVDDIYFYMNDDNKELWYSYGLIVKSTESKIKELKQYLVDNDYTIIFDKVSLTDLRILQKYKPSQEVTDAEE